MSDGAGGMGACPLPLEPGETVQLSHGSGGVMMHRLLEEVIFPALGGDLETPRHDGAVLFEKAAWRSQRIPMWSVPVFSRAATSVRWPCMDR